MEATMEDVPKRGRIQHSSPYGANRKTRRDWSIHFKRKGGAGLTKASPNKRQICGNHVRATEKVLQKLMDMFANIPIPVEYRTKHRKRINRGLI